MPEAQEEVNDEPEVAGSPAVEKKLAKFNLLMLPNQEKLLLD